MNTVLNKLAFNGFVVHYDQYRGRRGIVEEVTTAERAMRIIRHSLTAAYHDTFPDARLFAYAWGADGDSVTKIYDIDGNLLWDRATETPGWPYDGS